MTKLLQDKSIIKFLGIALSILLIVALVPQINIAYGSKDDVLADTGTEESVEDTDDLEGAEGAENAEGEEEGVLSEENVLDGATLDGEEPPAGEEAGIMATALPEENPDAGAETPADTTSTALANNESHTIEGDVTNTSSPLIFSGNKTYTLTVNGTLHSDIKVTGGAKLTIIGTGIIIGTHTGSVITVEGTGSKLILGETKDGESTGPTITNGTGTVFSGQENKRVGGGVFVKRTDASVTSNNYNRAASFWMKGGTIFDNTAQAGGGIYVDAACGFTMDGGTVDSNTAEDSEGGGIFVTSAYDYNFGSYAKINAGNITKNKTETKFAWGGGGVFVNSGGALNISYASITNNTAKGLGGGVSGCPHASIAVTTVTNGAAIFKNEAQGEQFPTNPRLRLLDTESVIGGNENKRVAAGDFLFDGLYEIDGLGKKGAEGRWSGFNASENGKSIFAQYGDYGKRADIAQYAKDFYCTRASYIAPTSLGDENGVAWKGLEIGIPAVNAKASVSSGNIDSHAVEILVADEEEGESTKKSTSYASLDATLGLTSQASEDPFAAGRKVNISGNYSATHGGGVASNGALEFGAYDWSSDSFEKSYELVLNKEIINSLGQEIGKNETGNKTFNENERFGFTLVEEDGTKHHAVSGADGTISFPGLPGLEESDFNGQSSVEKTVTFKLTEESVDGYKTLPESAVEVTLKGAKKVSKFLTAGNSMHTSTVYETAIKDNGVKINGEPTTTVTNTLDLETSANIPVTKIADGIAANAFTFGLKDVTENIGTLVELSGDKIVLNENADLAAQALMSPDKTATIEVEDSANGMVSATDEKTDEADGAFTFEYVPTTAEETHWYAIAERPGATAGVVYDTTAYLVKITTKATDDGRSLNKSQTVYKTTSDSNELQEVTGEIGVTFTNVATPKGTWQFKADKFFYGLGAPHDCSFTLQEIERAPEAGEPLANVLVSNDNLQQWTASIAAADLTDGHAFISFPAINYEQQGEGEGFQNDVGDHYYLITEDGDEAVKDTTAYVVKVTVAEDAANTRNLTATGTVLGYADDINSPLNPLTLSEGELPAFYNTDTYDLISAASYSVYAASGEPVDQVCYVDPKIVKNLEGRAIKSGEFAFKLIQVANYNDTEGELISATTNDEFGMVDFDKANNVSGDLENPSCLAYTKPGTYYYRVIEDTSKGGMNDQSVLYSDQVITFTTVIEQDETTGQLACTDMYYGWWDAAANQNVRFDEQYADYETQPGNIGDMSKLNPDWHPTINNKARPVDLQVRKTSVSDRDEGLVGATYALYMVNENPQGDIWLAEATSEEGGWITYKNVSLATNNLYYFKETAAPAGHTVSEFRSPYFYLVEDATSANGYALKYTDTKYFDAAETEAAAAAPMAAAEAQALQADIAAQAEATATDDQTQPGHSADGNILLTYDKDGGVYDETTQIEVNKLDTRTHEWVEGAKLVILDKESGKEVASWTSGKAPQKLAKTLNVGTTYLLREVEAPGEYRLANDVEFVIDNYGNVTITKGTENGNAELSDNTITLYDTMMDAEEVEQRERETTREVPLGTILAQTGDMLPILGIGLIVLASLIALIVAGRRRRAGKDDEN